jgi:hypothetical protein
MAYSNFTLEEVLDRFHLNLVEKLSWFADAPPVQPSAHFLETIEENKPMAIATEKARSEFLVAPTLVELRRLTHKQIALYSGIEFNVEPEQGLSGVCDFLIGKTTIQTVVKQPIVAVVEAKRGELQLGYGQCAASMLASRIFNKTSDRVYGVVTTGILWQFLRLSEADLLLDLEEYLNLEKVLGILLRMVSSPEGGPLQ